MRAPLVVLIVLACAAGVAGPASAEWSRPADSTGHRRALIDLDHPKHIPTALDSVPHPWPGLALILSTVGTAVPIVIGSEATKDHHDSRIVIALIGAEVLTPAAGHLYAGLGPRAVRGILTRAGAYGIFVAGAMSSGYWDDAGSSELTWGHLAMLAAVGAMGASAVWDVVTAPDDVERRNAAWLRNHVSLRLEPEPDASGARLALSARY